MKKQIPYLDTINGRQYLIVDGKPIFLRAGELHNSSASSLQYLDEHIWDALRPLHLNCVLLPVYWECVEPEEGHYDFTLLDGILQRARQEKLRLVLLWFGLWKNGCSSYAPGWAKRDGKRFFRSVTRDGAQMNFEGQMFMTISPLCHEAVRADARCFEKLMAHLAEADGEEQTVVAVQVENEIGALGSDRDYSDAANVVFAQPVPDALRDGLHLSGHTWADCFGPDANESFMAWQYASAVQQIAMAGKKSYPLPMYCNAWLKQPRRLAGEYPAGGPDLHTQRIWRIGAPAIDFYAPDIYIQEYRDVCDRYCAAGNPLFIPETRQTADCAPYCLYAIGHHGAIGFSPFGIEDMTQRAEGYTPEMLRLLDIREEAFQTGPLAGSVLAEVYAQLAGMGDTLTQAMLAGNTHGFLDQGEDGVRIRLQGCLLCADYDKHPGTDEPIAGGMVVELGKEEFIVLAANCALRVESGSAEITAIERCEEGRYQNGVWQRGRILNGDEQFRIVCRTMPKLYRFKVFTL